MPNPWSDVASAAEAAQGAGLTPDDINSLTNGIQ